MSVLKKKIGLFVLLLTSSFAYAQNCQDCKEAKMDSLCHDRSKCKVDIKYPKIDPYKKKFADLQIINTIGSHIKR